jgi:hypothetical protein
MASTPRNITAPPHDRSELAVLWHFLMRERVRYILAWLAALIVLLSSLYGCWHHQDDPDRADGSGGHVSLDYSGQWLMGHLLARGHGMHLYDRSYQRAALIEAYPVADQDPEQKRSDVEDIMYAMMGDDKGDDKEDAEAGKALGDYFQPLAADNPFTATALTLGVSRCARPELVPRTVAKHRGGPLYPPINALLCAPLGMLSPQTGFRVYQLASVLVLLAVVVGMWLLARGRVWLPVILVVILLLPGPWRAIALGQNAIFSLAIAVWGWVLVARGRPGWGGVAWGLLAYKPVWAAAFFLVPVLTRRWRMALTMLATGAALAAVTLPFVGLHGWRDWLAMGPEVTDTYNTDENWIRCSRDLLGIPRRWLIDFSLPMSERGRNWLAPSLIGWGMWVAALEITVRITLLRWRRPAHVEGPAAAFVLLGAWLSCFHFMHYDVFLAALPIMLLFTDPRRYLEPIFVAIRPLQAKLMSAGLLRFYQARPATERPPPVFVETGQGDIWLLNRLPPTLLIMFMLSHTVMAKVGDTWVPWDTFCVIGFWAWCGWMSLREN